MCISTFFRWIFCIQKGEKLSNFRGSRSWRLILLFSIFALVVVACGDTADEEEVVEESTETTEAPATTAAAVEEEAPAGPAGVYKMAIYSDPQTNNYWTYLDTENDVWTSYVMSGQAVSLYTLSVPNYQLVASMATELIETSTDNGDGTFSYSVPIAEGFEWSDGAPITANDWAFTFDTVKNLGLAGNWLGLWTLGTDEAQGVTSVEATDDYTVKVTFNFDPGLAKWQYGAAQAPALSKAYWEPIATDRESLLAADASSAPVASAFVYDKLEQGAFYTWAYDTSSMYAPGGEYTIYDSGGTGIKWDNGKAPAVDATFGDVSGDSFSYSVGPFVGTVEFTLYGDQDAAYLAFQDGEVDFVLNPLGVKRNTFNQLATTPGVETLVNNPNGMRYFASNTRIFPGSDKAFRQAIACIIDKEFIIDSVLQGTVESMDGMISSALTAWVTPTEGVMAECKELDSVGRWEKSISILQDAGWTADDWGEHPGNDTRAIPPTGIKGPNGEVAPDNMLIYAPGPGYDPLRNTFSLFIADYIRQLGFDVTARPTGFSVIVDIAFSAEGCKDWHFYMLGWGTGIFPDHTVEFFKSDKDSCDGGFNTPGFSNAEFDAFANQFEAAKTLEEAVAASNAMEKILYDELPYVVLFNPPVLEVYRSDSISLPFTDVLGGITDACSGCPGTVKKQQ
jgi:peptide/nickel transport system substrate-binding protein|tara:strand:- start:103 stop:2136 length:2034 start_codon:yes stop_codon:yes gene_type:complete